LLKAGLASTALASTAAHAQTSSGGSSASASVPLGINDIRCFLDQATRGALPGEAASFTGTFQEWIAWQGAMPFRPIDAHAMYASGYDNSNVRNNAARLAVFARMCSEPCQLRMRVSHVLQQIVCCGPSQRSAEMSSALWWSGITSLALSNYRNVLRWAITYRHMGHYLNNRGNDTSGIKAPSQSLARELLQLFSMGPQARTSPSSAGYFLRCRGRPLRRLSPAWMRASTRSWRSSPLRSTLASSSSRGW
jgi:hypothetical protein